MFNEERKQSFIKLYSSILAPSYLPNLFNKANNIEVQHNLDAANFHKPQIKELLQSFNAPSVNSLRIVTSILRTYTNWCIESKLSIDGINHFNEVDTDTLLSCINRSMMERKFITKEQLANYAENVINVVDKLIIYAIYEGIRGEDYCELLKLKDTDLNLKDMSFTLYTGRTVKVSKKLMTYTLSASKEYQYFSTKEGSFFVNSVGDNFIRLSSIGFPLRSKGNPVAISIFVIPDCNSISVPPIS